MALYRGISCLGLFALQSWSATQNFRAESGLEATCIEDLSNHPQSHHSSRLQLLIQKSHSVPRQRASRVGIAQASVHRHVTVFICSIGMHAGWLHIQQPELTETRGIDIYGKKNTCSLSKIWNIQEES